MCASGSSGEFPCSTDASFGGESDIVLIGKGCLQDRIVASLKFLGCFAGGLRWSYNTTTKQGLRSRNAGAV